MNTAYKITIGRATHHTDATFRAFYAKCISRIIDAKPDALPDNLRRTLGNIKDATRLVDVRSFANLGLAFLDVGHYNGLPYYNTDDTFWVLDGMNDWFLRFYADEPATFSIEHRYNDAHAVEAINKWVCYRLGGKIEVITR
ncbi:hypothetical protein [Acinetobacter sp.]|uniref:hypothetical protein n=1 Tax=Acinetobacter sp. TaxID=472 RepID=UPI00388CFD65